MDSGIVSSSPILQCKQARHRAEGINLAFFAWLEIPPFQIWVKAEGLGKHFVFCNHWYSLQMSQMPYLSLNLVWTWFEKLRVSTTRIGAEIRFSSPFCTLCAAMRCTPVTHKQHAEGKKDGGTMISPKKGEDGEEEKRNNGRDLFVVARHWSMSPEDGATITASHVQRW